MHVVATFPAPAAFFEFVLGPRQHDEHVRDRHREMVLRERRNPDAAAQVAAVLKAMRLPPTDEACLEVRDYMARPRHLRAVA